MLTIDFDRLGLVEGDRLIDIGCGAGRHTYQALRLGADVVALDQNTDDLRGIDEMVEAMAEEGEIKRPDGPVTLAADALALPFPDGSFERVIASEILEHIPDDRAAIAEIARVAKPGGTVAVSVPRRWTEQICWALSDAYHEVEGGHVRIYRGSELVRLLTEAGLVPLGRHHAHALHSPYWWLKCAVGVDEDHALTRAYHRVLVWDLMKRPWLTRTAERVLDPVLGKSLVLYLAKP
ncbi:Methyltransferase domain-containing protein [Jatrophihabitans endophyticus]|uniref:Methyltransferase domain-containing protein n=1 Tax=Jatrophihabitans endophyticus TaxID=1206085 RepID=A0A1M5KLT6_9ACTN|nr:class I SAM-dependent methyltransferase [Jatrophihabitans endophyticus]SHG53728.1 Methyltransferase domain-containing protein [Jatrophihabitans endophyticus]